MSEDEYFRDEAVSLARTSMMAAEEAQSYVDGIQDEKIRKEAQEEIDDIFSS